MKGRILVLVAVLAFMVPMVHGAQEPRRYVETPPHWTSGDLAIYLFGFPREGATYTQETINVRIAVWGATETNPVIFILDGAEAARIEGEGLFTYEWKLQGTHQLLVRGEYKIFDQATFNVKAPPPPAPVILLEEFNNRLEQQRSTMILAMVGATALGVPSGIHLKKRTKITTSWALMPPGLAMGLGFRYLPDLYMLVPWGLAAALTYQLAKPYAVDLGILRIQENGINLDLIHRDDDGYKVVGVSPRYWRSGFIKRKKLETQDEYPVLFQGRKYTLTCLCVKSIEEAEDTVKIQCDRALARVLMIKNVVKALSEENAKLEARNNLLESGGTAAYAAQLRSELTARLVGIMQGEQGDIDPHGLIHWMENLTRKADREARKHEQAPTVVQQ